MTMTTFLLRGADISGAVSIPGWQADGNNNINSSGCVYSPFTWKACIEKFCEFRETLTIKLKTILSEAICKMERATTILGRGVQLSSWKRRTPEMVMI